MKKDCSDARFEVLTVLYIIIMIMVYQTQSLTTLHTVKLHTEVLQKSMRNKHTMAKTILFKTEQTTGTMP
jgi:hypothetical protein